MLSLLQGAGSQITSISVSLACMQLVRNAARAPATPAGSLGICTRTAEGSIQRMLLLQEPLEIEQILP